jgi:hypothetical protein
METQTGLALRKLFRNFSLGIAGDLECCGISGCRIMDEKELTPWMHQREIEMILKSLSLDQGMLEWGAGGSTTLFSKSVRSYYSIEHELHWYQRLASEVSKKNINVKLILVHPNAQRTTPSRYEQFKDYVDAVSTLGVSYFDRVLIDGRARPECAKAVLPYIDKKSVVFIHDFYMPGREYYRSVLDHYEVVDSIMDTPQTLVLLRKK